MTLLLLNRDWEKVFLNFTSLLISDGIRKKDGYLSIFLLGYFRTETKTMKDDDGVFEREEFSKTKFECHRPDYSH